ncbi:alpha/beta hydrolase [Maricaulis sp.]|uniref:alpha/beta fold hydrolase n=1 Tax=Maricaulis sp. TaxID=1486257 RepID=UPI00261CF788|nr:alpha/beta hydrolase [Maricaulis sp.]
MLSAKTAHHDPSHRRELVMPDGNPLCYFDYGEGPAIVLVHGWAASSQFFEDLSARLARDHRVIIPDLRAHGETPAGDTPLSIKLLASDVAALIDALELDNAVALGWSMGALVLWQYLSEPGRRPLAGLVVEDMSPRILNSADWSLGMVNGLDAASSARALDVMRKDWPAYVRAFTPHMFARDTARGNPDLVARTSERMRHLDSDAMARLWASMAQQDLRPALPAIRVPTLIAYGGRSDAYGPETSRYLVETLPNASRQEFSRSGHAPHLEEPTEFEHAVRDFASRVQTAANPVQNIEGST